MRNCGSSDGANWRNLIVDLEGTKMELRAYRNELIAARLDFLLWGYNWVCVVMVQEWHDNLAPDAKGL